MLKNFVYLFVIGLVIQLLGGCNLSKEKQRYRGFAKVIDVKDIKPLTKKNSQTIIDLEIPASDSMLFDYNKNLKDIHFVKLETSKKAKFGSIDKMFITNGRIIIVDLTITKSIYIFDSSGHFINKISSNAILENKSGVIPYFVSATYDYNRDEIVLHCVEKGKLYYFDNNGKFLNQTKEYIYFLDFASLKNSDEYLYYNPIGGNSHIPILNNSPIYIGKINTNITYETSEIFKSFKPRDFYINSNPSFCAGDKIFYSPDFSDTIYQIKCNPVAILVKVVLHFPTVSINEKLRGFEERTLENFIRLFNKQQYFSFKGEILCNSDSVYFVKVYKKNETGYFYSSKTRKMIGGKLTSTINMGESAQMEAFRYPVTTFNDYFVSILPSSDFGSYKWPTSEMLNKIKNNLKPTDNPILAFYKLNDF